MIALYAEKDERKSVTIFFSFASDASLITFSFAMVARRSC